MRDGSSADDGNTDVTNQFANQEQVHDERREWRREQQRVHRKSKQQARRSMLEAMGKDARELFLKQEFEHSELMKEEHTVRLQQAFEFGTPKVVLNCSFSDIMGTKELRSMARQAQMCFRTIRDTKSVVQLHMTSLQEGNPVLPWLEALSFRNWMVHVHSDSVWNVFDPEKLVVLTPDAEVDLECIDDASIYVIGGLVDRTVDKHRSLTQATEHGVHCIRRLPLKKYGPPGASAVLNIDVVLHILSEVHLRGARSWPQVFMECLPPRHSGQPTRRMRHKERVQQRCKIDGD